MNERPILCLVTNRGIASRPLVEMVAEAISGGVDWIQIREPDLAARELLELSQRIQELVRRESERKVLINRRLDVALSVGADGAHLGWSSVTIAQARELLGNTALVGCAAHDPSEVEAAAAQGASYAHLAPIFSPLSKQASRTPLGLKELRKAARAGIPVLAQGGITAKNARSVIEAGAHGIAVTGEILMSANPAKASRALREALDSA